MQRNPCNNMKGEIMLYNYGLIKFKKMGTNELGYLSAIEEMRDIPFSIKRVYYITDVPSGTIRGFHAHRLLHQVLICMQGSVTIKIYNENEKTEIVLNKSDVGLYLGPMTWREMSNFSKDCVLTVLASEYYSEDDYIRDYDMYLKECETFYK